MSHVFDTSNPLATPWPAGVRLLATAVHAVVAAAARALERARGGQVRMTPVSDEWLIEYEKRSGKRQGDGP